VACLSGKNGHGKSALVDAITWALWGRCRVKNKEEVIKRGEKEATVELEFEVDGNRYRVLRSIVRKRGFSTSSTIDFQVFDTEAGSFRPLAQGGEAQNRIEKILKMDYDSFICSSFILQGKADEFTKKTPAERKEILANILELDKYERLSKKAKELYQKSKLQEESLRREVSQIESEISQKENLEKSLEEIKTQEDKITRDLIEGEKLYEGVIREAEALRAKIETHKGLVRDRDKINEDCTRLEKELEKLNQEIEKHREITSREEEIIQGYREFERIIEEERIFSEKLIQYTSLIKEQEGINRQINDEKSKIEQRISALSGKKEELEKRLVQIVELLKRESEIKAGFREFLDTESLQKELEQKKQASEKLVSRKIELENNIEKIRFQTEAQIEDLRAKISGLTEKVENIESLNEECGNIRTRIKLIEESQVKCEALKTRLKEIEEEKKASIWRKSEAEKRKKEEIQKLDVIKSESHKTRCPLCESPLGEEARKALIEKIEKTILDLENTIKEESEKIKKLEKNEKAINSEVKSLESEIKSISELSKQLGEKEKTLQDSISARKDLELARNELNKLMDKIKKEEFGFEFRDELRKITEEIRVLGYNEKKHKEIDEKLESLRKFETENAVLEREKESKSGIEGELLRIQAEIVPLRRVLEEGLFAMDYKEQALRIQQRISEIGYDEEKHKELKIALRDLERFSKEKENLDKAKLSLSLREKEREGLEVRLKAERERVEKIEKEIKELEQIVNQSKALEEKKRLIEDKISRLKKDKDEVIGEKSRILSELERITKLEDKKEEILKQTDKLTYDLTIYQELEKAFGKNGIQALIIENAVPEIEEEANKILRKLTDGSMILQLKTLGLTQKGTEKETLEIIIGDSSGTRSYETYSGGEAFRIDFALRVAISKFIANRSGAQLRTLVIDEGFGTQDKDGLSQFIQVINAIKDDFDKILVITHVDELKDRFPVRIEVTKETGKGSSFEVIYS
jgi:exonuclease SbcC